MRRGRAWGNPPDDPTWETVPRSPDEVKCNAATPWREVYAGPSAVLFMAADGLYSASKRNGVCDADDWGREPGCRDDAGRRARAGRLGATVQRPRHRPHHRPRLRGADRCAAARGRPARAL